MIPGKPTHKFCRHFDVFWHELYNNTNNICFYCKFVHIESIFRLNAWGKGFLDPEKPKISRFLGVGHKFCHFHQFVDTISDKRGEVWHWNCIENYPYNIPPSMVIVSELLAIDRPVKKADEVHILILNRDLPAILLPGIPTWLRGTRPN